jgi:hypothetical protein
MKIDKLLQKGLWLLAGALLAQVALGMLWPVEPRYVASWANNPRSLAEAKDSSDEIVTGRVMRVRRTDDLVLAVPGEPGNVDSIPVEVVTVKVETRHKGGKGKPQTIELFHTGLSKKTPPSERGGQPPGPPPAGARKPARQLDESPLASRTIILSDDPPYESGERYVLFLRPGPMVTAGGARVATQRVLSPEWRYRVKGDGRIDPISKRAAFAQQQRGRRLREFEALVR